MAKTAEKKKNLNINVREETVERIEQLKELTFRSSVGDVVDLAISELHAKETTKVNGNGAQKTH